MSKFSLAEPLKNHFDVDVPQAIASMVAAVHPAFAVKQFTLFMPHCFFVAEFGLGHFEESMQAQHVLTQRFTCEFSIRPFLIHHQAATLKRLHEWAGDPSERVRRLVSEGSRPRLPWATRLPAFQVDPSPVLDLLERLKDDPALYVRRSVANNLNDIGKDHPQILSSTATRWLQRASPEREWIVRHALRWAVKQGEPGALQALGFGKTAQIEIASATITPNKARLGGDVSIQFELINVAAGAQDLMVDLAVHYVKSSGASRAKVFKLRALTLGAGQAAGFSKKLSLREMTTRKHFTGAHQVDAVVNGKPYPMGSFELIDALI